MKRWVQAVAARLVTTVVAVAVAAAAVGTSGLLPASAAPDGFQDFQGGLKVLLEQWAGANRPGTYKTAYDQPTVIKYWLDRGWSTAALQVCDALANWLGRGDLLAKGVTLYDPDASNRPPQCQMGSAGSLSIQDHLGGNVVALDYYVTGNSLRFKSTLPGPEGSYADPEFEVTYDLELITTVHVGDSVSVSVDSAVVRVRNASMHPKNLQGEIAKAASDIIKFFTGSGFINKWEAQINNTTSNFTDQVKKQLAIVGALLGGFAQQGYREMHGRLEGGTLALYLSGKDFQVPTSGPGSIRGFIQWKKSDGHAQGSGSGCLALGVQATTQSGYSSADQQRFAPYTNVGAAQISAAPIDAGDSYRCDYVIKNLPTGVPLIVQVSPTSGWTTSHGVLVVPRAQQLGWSGVITIMAPVQGFPLKSAPAQTGNAGIGSSARLQLGNVEPINAGQNPRGVQTVSNINFVLIFQQAPQ